MAILGESQEMLADLVGRYMAENFDYEKRRKVLATDGWTADLWRVFAQDLGIVGLPFAEELGGLGLGSLDVMVVMEALGKALAAEPFLSTVVGFGTLANRLDESMQNSLSPLIGDIVAGHARVALAILDPHGAPGCGNRTLTPDGTGWRLTGDAPIISAAAGATHILISAATPDGATALILVSRDMAGFDWRDIPLIDGTTGGALKADAQIAQSSLIARDAAGLLSEMHDAILAALGAEITGIVSALIAITVDFANQRTQFGKPIAKFQVLQHKMADMYVEGELARSMALLAALKLDASPLERAAAAAACKARTATAGRMVAQNAVQIHGGIGTTDELVVGQYFKRLLAIEAIYGGAGTHVKNYALCREKLGMPLPVV